MSDWVPELFQAIDRMDTDTFVKFLTEDSTFRFGNAQSVQGKENVHGAVAGFFASIKAISHKLLGTWRVGDVVFVQGEVT
jgi:ketosteroid isomerase-like protein